MKILVLSDSHGSKKALLHAFEHVSPDLTLHLGDHDSDCDALQAAYPDAYIRTVRGNGDCLSRGLDIDQFTFGGQRIYMTHGHLFGVKRGLDILLDNARSLSADIVLFGHTHIKYYAEIGGMSIINPGSVGLDGKTFAALSIERGGISCDFISIKDI